MIVVNTCAFIDRAKQESVDAILEMARAEGGGPGAAAGGDGLPGAALRRGAAPRDPRDRRHAWARARWRDIVRAVEGEATTTDAERRPPTWVYDHTRPRVLSTPAYLAYVKISEGCDYTCSLLHHPHAARPAPQPAGSRTSWPRRAPLAERGVKEIVLVAQDSTRYGLDLGHARRPGLAAAPAGARRRHPLDPRDVRVPGHGERPDPRRDRRARRRS